VTQRARTLLAVGLLAGLAALAGVVYATTRSAGAHPGATSAGRVAPAFTAPSIGGVVSLAALRGHPVVLGFVQAGCASCAADLQTLSHLAARNSNARFVALNVAAGPAAQLRRFADALGAHGLMYASDQAGRITRSYGVTQIDTIMVFNPAGRIVWQAVRPSQGQVAAALHTASA
jgi:peroxiredoxin